MELHIIKDLAHLIVDFCIENKQLSLRGGNKRAELRIPKDLGPILLELADSTHSKGLAGFPSTAHIGKIGRRPILERWISGKKKKRHQGLPHSELALFHK